MLTFTEFSGSPYHIGLALGKFGARPAHDILLASPQWEHVLQWRGSEHVQAMQHLVQQQHPYIWDEIQGLARGLELPPEDVFLWNCRDDLPSTVSAPDTPYADPISPDSSGTGIRNGQARATRRRITEESTTLLIPTSRGPRLAHSLTSNIAWAKYCGVAEFTMDQGPTFASFICPGSLPGHTFAVTDGGLVITGNAIVSDAPAAGIPSSVLARTLLNLPDMSSAIQFLNESARSGGLHLALAQRGGSALLSIEFDATKVSIQPVKAPTCHTNHLVHEIMQDLPQTITASSRHRHRDGLALLNGSEDTEPLRILANQTNDVHPIYHGPHSDGSSAASQTLALADIRLGPDAVDWNIHAHPDEPARFCMRDGKHI